MPSENSLRTSGAVDGMGAPKDGAWCRFSDRSAALADQWGPATIPLLLFALSVLIYLPFLSLPLLPDDYLQVTLGRKYGPVSAWGALALDPLYRSRATSLVLTYWTEMIFGFSRLAFGFTSLLLHGVNTVLVYQLGRSRSLGWRLGALTALFFVLQERYHEAVIWYSALPEQLAFFFVLAALLLWIEWLHSPAGSILKLSSAVGCFCLALLSKESAVAALLLMVLFIFTEGDKRRGRALCALTPFGLLTAVYIGLVFSGQEQNHHFWDGTFSLHASAVLALVGSAGRALWIWGLIGLAILFAVSIRTHSFRKQRGQALLAVGWTLIALIPYSFLTYMPRVPSRHHYLAAVGCAVILALAAMTLQERFGKPWIIAVCAVLIGVHHATYLWTVKYRAFEARAEPIESLLRYMKVERERPVVIGCFPYSFDEGRRAVTLRLGEPAESLIQRTGSLDRSLPSFCANKTLSDAH
jgi:hypothetical protein